MSTKYIKLPSQQAGIVADNSLLDLDIPDYGNYDLSKSYISSMVSIATTDSAIQAVGDTDPVGIHSVSVSNANKFPFRNNVFIGDYSITNDKFGNIDGMMSSNIINTNLDIFGRDFEQMNNENYKQMLNFKDVSYTLATTSVGSVFRELTKNGPSRELPFELKVPLSSFSSFCGTQSYGGRGTTRIHAQLKTDQIAAPTAFHPYPNPLQFQCLTMLADAQAFLTTNAYYGSFAGFTNADRARITGTRPGVPLVLVDEFVTLTGAPINAGAGVWTIPIGGGTLGNIITNPQISFGHLPADTTACDDIEIGVIQNYVTQTAALADLNAALDAYIAIIGKPVLINGTNLAGNSPATTYIICTLTDVVLVSPFSTTTSDIRLFVDAYLIPTDPTVAISAITIAYSNVLLMPPTFANYTNNAGANVDLTTIICNNVIPDQLLLWVGQRVVVYGLNNLVYFRQTCLVQSVQGLNVTFNRPICTVANLQLATNMTLATLPAATQTLTYANTNLVLRQLPPVSIFPPIVFRKFTVEPSNIPIGTLSWNKLFSIDPSVQNLYVLVLNNRELISDNVISSYRWKVNNVDKFARDVAKDSSLEKDNVITTFSSSSKKLQSLIKTYGSKATFMPMCQLQAGQVNTVQLTLTFDGALAGDKIFYLIKEGDAQI